MLVHQPPETRGFMVGLVGLAIGLGASAMALTTWFYFALRLRRLANDLDRTVDTGAPIMLKESGVPAERRLARAFTGQRARSPWRSAGHRKPADQHSNRESRLDAGRRVERATRVQPSRSRSWTSTASRRSMTPATGSGTPFCSSWPG
jgi:hypothetical protein